MIRNLKITFVFCILIFLVGCARLSDLERAQNFVKQADVAYQQAVEKYKGLIAKGDNLEALHRELGQLYYKHGDFKLAIDEFKNSASPVAKKFLALSYYRLGNFTDAFEIFSKAEAPDDAYRYYYGLTCEKLNLFDQALAVYKKITEKEFASQASERTNIIEKQAAFMRINEIDPKINEILKHAPSLKEYPQAGAFILHCDEKIEITPLNTQVSSLHYIIKILNERGKEGFSETHIDYDSTYEKIELEYARTIKPDGTVVEVGTRHIRDVSKYLNFPLYSNARVYIISFPEVSEGAAIEYKLKIHRSHLINKKDFVLIYPLQAPEPIIAANLTLDLPQEKIPYIKILNEKYNDFAANLSADKQEINGRIIYAWQFKNIPQIIPEPNMPPNAEINPTLLISTFSSWQEVYDWWWPLAKDKLKADTVIKEAVKELIQNLASDEAKIRAIYNFCSQKIRYVAVEYGQAGYEPHYAADIFKNKYGDCKDKAVLLVTMLKEAGFPAWPVLIATKEYYNLNTDFPSMLFNHAIAAVSLKEETIIVDPTAETCAFGDLPADDQARKVLVIKENNFQIQETPLYPGEHNLIKTVLKIKVDHNENITAAKSIFAYGLYEQIQRYWLLYTPPELIAQTLRERIQDISIGAVLDKYNVKNLDDLNQPVVLDYTFYGREYFTTAGTLRLMPQLTALDTSLVAHEKRKYAIDFPALDIKETVFEIELPASFKVKYLPDNVNEDSPWLKFEVTYEQKNNKIIFRQKNELKKNIISVDEYADFKALFEGLAKKIKQRIILEKWKTSAANISG